MKKKVSKQSQEIKAMQKEFQTSQLETGKAYFGGGPQGTTNSHIEQTGGDLAAAQEQLEEVDTALKAQREEVSELKKEQAKIKDLHDIALAHLEDERAKLTGYDEELQALEEAIRSKSSRIAEEALEKQKLGHDIERFHKDQQTSTELVARMERENEWIEDEKVNFGRRGTAYDFHGQNINECRSSLRNLTERFQGMKKKINPKVMNMIDSVEKKEVALKNMLRTVVKDKRKIEETIQSLDKYKKEALHKTWQKVTGDFGSIFAELLPGSFAKLEPPEGKEVSDGLEVKVSLGKVWKQSLTELSGGQRLVFSVKRL